MRTQRLFFDENACRLNPGESGAIDALLRRKVVLITGAGGSVGSQLALAITDYSPKTIILLESSEHALYQIDRKLKVSANSNCQIISLLGSICDCEFLEHVFSQYQIDILYHTASYKHVPLLENNILAAVKNNILGTYHIAKVCAKYRLKQAVLISTDKAVRAKSIMGKTKRVSEIIFQAAGQNHGHATRFSIIRFGNLFGSSGSVVPLFIEQIARKGPVTVTHPEITRFFIHIKAAIDYTLLASTFETSNRIVILDMGKPVKIVDLAKCLIEDYGYSVRSDSNPQGDIAISFIGLRPGEKLHEELSISDLRTSTSSKKIQLIEEPSISWEELEDLIAKLTSASRSHNTSEIEQILPC